MQAIAWSQPQGRDQGPRPETHFARKRPRRWRPLELAAMIAGFVIFWPVGLAVLGWKLNWFGFGAWFDAKFGTNRMTPAGEGFGWGCGKGRGDGRGEGPDGELRRDSGNSAFEAWKEGEFARLQAEYEALSRRQREFEAFLQHLREAKDREEFERFMQDRAAGRPAGDQGAGA